MRGKTKMGHRVGLVLWGVCCVLLVMAPAAHAEHYAVLFSGGSYIRDADENHERYYNATLGMYNRLVNPNRLGYKPENVWVLFSDGLDPGIDLDHPIALNSSSDWSSVDARGSTVLEASSANLEATLRGLHDTDPEDLVMLWTYDHGHGSKNKYIYGEEELVGWGSGIADEELAEWCGGDLLGGDPGRVIGAYREVYIFSQCYSGGMLDDLHIDESVGPRFGCASGRHYEVTQSTPPVYNGFAQAWNDAISDGLTRTSELFEEAEENTTAAHWVAAWHDLQHPYMEGANLDIAVSRWAGDGAGGTGQSWQDAANWGVPPVEGYDDRTTIVEFTSAGKAVVDAGPMAWGGYLTVDYLGLVGDSAWLEIADGGSLRTGRHLTIGGEHYGRIVQTGGLHVVPNSPVVLGRSPITGRGEYEISAGQFTAHEGVVLGVEGFGRVTQTGGTVQVSTSSVIGQALCLGDLSSGYGEYDLSGTGVLETQSVVVGNKGLGRFTQTGGTHTVSGWLYVGRFCLEPGTGQGTYLLHGGSLSAATEVVGDDGYGTVEQTGGTHTVAGWLALGLRGCSGSYTLSGDGQLVAGIETVGGAGDATFVQSGNTTHTVTGTLEMAWGSESVASYTMEGGRLTAHRAELGNEGEATFTQTGGTVVVQTDLAFALDNDGSGTYTITDGTLDVRNGTINLDTEGSAELNINGGLVIADTLIDPESGRNLESAGPTGVLRVNNLQGMGYIWDFEGSVEFGHDGGGDLLAHYEVANSRHVTVGANLVVGHNAAAALDQTGTSSSVDVTGDLIVGRDSTANGSYHLSGAGATLTAGGVTIGVRGTGSLTHTRGTNTIATGLVLGEEATGDGTYTLALASGQVMMPEVPALAAASETIGLRGSATFDHQAGTNTVAGTLHIGREAGSHGVYNLGGGTLSAPTIEIGVGGTGELHVAGQGALALETDAITIGPGGSLICNRYWTFGRTITVDGGTLSMTDHALTLDDPDGAMLNITDSATGASALAVGVLGSAVTTSMLVVGEAATGAVEQSAGNNTTSTLILGSAATGEGTYTLSDGQLTATHMSEIGFLGKGTLTQTGGAFATQGKLILGVQDGSDGTYTLAGGTMSCDTLYVGYHGIGHFIHTGGTYSAGEVIVGPGSTMTTSQDLHVPDRLSLYGASMSLGTAALILDGTDAQGEMGDGSSLESGDQCYGDTQRGAMKQMGGTNRARGTLTLGRGPGSQGSYSMSGGILVATDLFVGGEGEGSMDITGPGADITVERTLRFGPHSTFTAVHNTAFHMTGSAFENESTDPAALAGLASLDLIFEGGTTDIDPFEVAGKDIGTAPEGWDLNFELGTLTLGGSAGVGQVVLVDTFDNQPGWDGAEALYVRNLVVGPGSTLDLNGLHLYYLTAQIDPDATIVGGGLIQIPEPATVLLLAGATLALLRRRRAS